MSQRRRIGRERYTIPQKRNRAEVLAAAGGVVAVLVATLVIVWLLRPGPLPGTGGLAHRQPRATWLLVLSGAAAIGAVAWIRGSRSRIARRPRVAIPGALALVAVAAVAAGTLWPGGLLRHPPSLPDLSPVEGLPDPATQTTVPGETTVPDPATETTVPGETTVPDPAPETTVPGETTAPAATTGSP